MTTLDPSTRGRANRRNGHDAERAVARYLRQWWPDTCRAVRNTHPDPGDIDGTSPALWWSVKDCQQERTAAWLAELDQKAVGRLGLLVVRRRGHANPGEWWVWLDTGSLAELITYPGAIGPQGWPVRTELRHLVPLLVLAGYGTQERGREDLVEVSCVRCGRSITITLEERATPWMCGRCARSPVAVQAEETP